MSKQALAVKTSIEKVETGLPAKERKKIAENLGTVLGDTYTLLVKTHVYHWNVVGPLFLPLHELTEAHYNDLFQAADTIAERIRSLGFPAPMTLASIDRKSKLDGNTGSETAAAMVDDLVGDHEEMVRRIRSITADAAEAEDFVTHDMLNARLAFHEKAIWMYRAIIA
ncbi:MAG: DNA starvation/stationary phase protection protein [Hyphomicrobiaceae bacterium]|nr:DNA starvation/stationary phase protection protein [Hyphomicrobiaceae bacterium]